MINAEIVKWKVGNNIISQTCDGTSVMTDGKNGVQKMIILINYIILNFILNKHIQMRYLYIVIPIN